MFSLDFTLVTAEERNNFVKNLDLSSFTPAQLELCANYILYGKDSNGKSEVDKKNIYINTKYNSYKHKKTESLEELIEHPNFEELINKSKIKYKTVKPSIDREKDKDIPTITEMWENIDRLQYILDVNLGKINDPKIKKLSDNGIYKLKHLLIDIRRGQYYLKDIFKPTINKHFNKLSYVDYEDNEDIPWNDPESDYGFAPLGLYGDMGLNKLVFTDVSAVTYAPDLYNHKAKYIIDFRNPKHIYTLMERYEELATMKKGPTTLNEQIIKTLNYYIDRANLKDQHYVIINMKRKKISNKEITNKLTELYGMHHTENYISTIWTQKICKEIAAAATLHYDEFLNRDNSEAWKVCNTCGKKKLRDNRMFVKRAKAGDGLSSRCKECDKVVRLRNKLKGGK